MKFRKKKSTNVTKTELDKKKLNLLKAEVYFDGSREYFPSDLVKSKELIEKALHFSPQNKIYRSLYDEITRMMSVGSSSSDGLHYYYKELIIFIESKMNAHLVISNETSFTLVSKPIMEKNQIDDLIHKKVINFVVEEEGNKSNLHIVETISVGINNIFERNLMRIPIWRGITVEEFVKLQPIIDQ